MRQRIKEAASPEERCHSDRLHTRLKTLLELFFSKTACASNSQLDQRSLKDVTNTSLAHSLEEKRYCTQYDWDGETARRLKRLMFKHEDHSSAPGTQAWCTGLQSHAGGADREIPGVTGQRQTNLLGMF